MNNKFKAFLIVSSWVAVMAGMVVLAAKVPAVFTFIASVILGFMLYTAWKAIVDDLDRKSK